MPENTGDQPTPAPVQDTPPTSPDPVQDAPAIPTPPPAQVVPTTPTSKTEEPLSEEQVASMQEKITKDVSGEVSKSVIQKIGDALGLTKKEEEALPTDPATLKKLVDEAVTKRFERVSTDAEKQEQEDVTARQGRIDNIVKGWHFQYNDLSRIGRVPAIKNLNDTTDEGVVARRKLIMAIGRIIDEVRKTDPNSDHVPSISEAMVRYPGVLSAPPGADLPISGDTAVREGEATISYEKDVAGKSFEQIVDQSGQG